MSKTIDDACQAIVSWWRAQHISQRDELAAVLEGYRVRFAYHSGTIENPELTYHDTRDVFEDGRVHGFTGDPRTLFEIHNLKTCHELLLDSFGRRQPLDEAMLLEVHQTLTQGTYDGRRWQMGERPGSYKVGDYVVGAGDVGATPHEVQAEISCLLEELESVRGGDALTIAAYFHAVFENIHPFADGNGRVGRALMNYLLLLHDHPPVIVFEGDRMAYYGAMEVWDAERDLDPFRTFLRVELVRTWELVLKKQ